MRKLLCLLALLLVVGVSVGSTPAQAFVPLPLPNCDTFCPGQSGGATCVCQPGTMFQGRSTTCSNWIWDCTYP
jgi:hypothetical protein